MSFSRGRFLPVAVSVVVLWSAGACGRTELETRPWHDYDAGRQWFPPDVPDVGPDVEPDVPDVEPDVPDVEPDVPPDVPPDADTYEFHGLSCMSAAMCALCCGASGYSCMMGCVSAADPSESSTLMAIVGCVASSGCGTDMACLMESCNDQINACAGGPGGTGGCLSLAWCLVSAGCSSVTDCEEQGTCYQTCFGAARPDAIGAARDLVVCIASVCMADCATGLTTTACLGCLATNCLTTLRGCIGL
jgi:hypothetical protein